MSVKSIIRAKLYRTQKGELLFLKVRGVREKIALRKMDDETYIRATYRERYGQEINLANPQKFQEKLQWLKLFYRNELMPICSDKYEIRSYLRSCNLESLANDVIGVYENARDINFDSLPNKFVAKATHGSGWNIVCTDKSKLHWKDCVRILNEWLKLNLYVFGREWNYKDIHPRIVVEKYIEHEPLNDYKFMCFNGVPRYLQLNNDFEGAHYVDFYNLDGWKHLPATYGPYVVGNRELEKPPQYEKLYELAEQLSKPFPFVRVDFYSFDETIILGELTFFPGGGLWPFVPMEYGCDEEVGKWLELPEPNYNLDLYQKIMNKA